MTAEDRWNFIQWVQDDFKGYCEGIGDVQLNYTPNGFWHAVQKFDVKVTGTAKPKPEPVKKKVVKVEAKEEVVTEDTPDPGSEAV